MKKVIAILALLLAIQQGKMYGQVTMETFKTKSQTESRDYFLNKMTQAKAKEKSGDLQEAILIYTSLTKENVSESDRRNLYNALEVAQIKFNSHINNKVSEMIIANDNTGILNLLLDAKEEMSKSELDRQTLRMWTNVFANANQYASTHDYSRLNSLFTDFTPEEFGYSLSNPNEKLMPAKNNEYAAFYYAYKQHKENEERKILEAQAKEDSIKSANYYASYHKERHKVRWHSKGLLLGSIGTLLGAEKNYGWEAGIGAQIRTSNSFIGFELSGTYTQETFINEADKPNYEYDTYYYKQNPILSYIRIAPKILFLPFKNKSYGLHFGYTLGIPN